MTNEAFARVKIDALLAAQGWDTLDPAKGLSQERAAESLWSMLIATLQ